LKAGKIGNGDAVTKQASSGYENIRKNLNLQLAPKDRKKVQ